MGGIGTMAGYDNSNGLPRVLPRSSSVDATGMSARHVRRSMSSAMMVAAGTLIAYNVTIFVTLLGRKVSRNDAEETTSA